MNVAANIDRDAAVSGQSRPSFAAALAGFVGTTLTAVLVLLTISNLQ